MRDKRVYNLVLLAMFFAIIAVLTFTPIGFFQLPGGVSLTIVHIPVLIGACILGKKNGAILGLFMGLSSLFNALRGSGGDGTFIFPWVSILPRLFFGFAAGFIYELIEKTCKEKKNWKSIALIMGSFIATYVCHTWIVYFPYVPTYCKLVATDFPLNMTAWRVAAGIFAVNGFFEGLIAAIVVPAIVVSLKQLSIKKK